MPCSGNASQTCGAAARLSVFKSLAFYAPPSNPVIKGYTYRGCYTDSVQTRVLQDSFLYKGDMTVAMCAAFCDGKRFFGVEYAEQCYCGDVLGASDKRDEGECGMGCGGDQGSFCGAGDRIGVWVRD